MNAQTVLIVEDEKDIRDLLAYNLKREGFAVLEAADGKTGFSIAREKLPDVILLDLMLPGMDGLSVCKALQKDESTAVIPVLMLTAKGEEIDRIVGLELGADDYIVKPFSVREVILRVRAVLRRGTPVQEVKSLRCGGITINLAEHTVNVGCRVIELTITEFKLLEDLLRNRDKVRTREQLLDSVWGYSFEGYARTVDTHVRRLRIKLEECAELVETVRGVGYRARSGSVEEVE